MCGHLALRDPVFPFHSVANRIAAMPALMAAWLAETGSVTRRPGPMARASHGMDAAAQDTANRMLIASTGAGLAAAVHGRHRAAGCPGRLPARSGGHRREHPDHAA